MDLLAGYGSGSEASEQSEGRADDRIPREPAAQEAATQAPSSSALPPSASGGLFASLPKPGGASNDGKSAGLLASLPKPGAGARKRVLRLPLKPQAPSDSESDEEGAPAAQAAAPQPQTAAGFLNALPAPKFARAAGSFGGASAGTRGGEAAERDGNGAQTQEAFPESNDMYRVDDSGAWQHAAPAAPHDAYAAAGPSAQRPAAGEPAAGLDPELEKALEEAGRGDRKRIYEEMMRGTAVKEVTGHAVLASAPGGGANSMATLRDVMGTDYHKKVRVEAGEAPTKMEKRKHQIRSLYHSAKMAELEMLDQSAGGAAKKATTARKYGW
ncbi:unnamed protein product [Pedinophyceae sp. YPF-701]|nr:unnamed protein product [Pedinophyceae sp. YPF-701]